MVTSRKSDWLLIIVFVAILIVPPAAGVFGLAGDTSIEAREQRVRAPWPAAPRNLLALDAFPEAVQRWFDDRFGMRDPLILLHNAGKALLGVSPKNTAIIGRDGWLFIEQSRLTDANRGALPFADGELALLLDHFLALQTQLERAGIQYLQFTPPDKQSIHADQLPARIRFVGPSRYALWRDAAAASPLHFVDVYAALAAARDSGQHPYLQTDSHWNCLGAFIAYEEAMAALAQRFAGPLRVLTAADVRFDAMAATPGRDLARNVIGVPSLFPEGRGMTCTIPDAAAIDYRDLVTGEALTRRALDVAPRSSRAINPAFKDGARAVVVRDSYANAMIDFFNQSFGEVIYLHRAPDLPEAALIEELAPDVVIVEHVERSLFSYARRLQRLTAASATAGGGPRT